MFSNLFTVMIILTYFLKINQVAILWYYLSFLIQTFHQIIIIQGLVFIFLSCLFLHFFVWGGLNLLFILLNLVRFEVLWKLTQDIFVEILHHLFRYFLYFSIKFVHIFPKIFLQISVNFICIVIKFFIFIVLIDFR